MKRREIQKILRESLKIDIPESSIIINREISKRNKVFWVKSEFLDRDLIIKTYDFSENRAAYENELAIYKNIKNNTLGSREGTSFRIPKLICGGPDYLILERVDGNNLMDLITEKIRLTPINDDFWRKIITDLIYWEISFYNRYQYLTGDNHIRNFILSGYDLYRVDFESYIKKTINFDNFIEVIVELYFFILSAAPGIVEGQNIKIKTEIAKKFITVLEEIRNDDLLDIPGKKKIITMSNIFIKKLEKIAERVLTRRVRFDRITQEQYVVTMKILQNEVSSKLKSY